jgi:hypothetical protein
MNGPRVLAWMFEAAESGSIVPALGEFRRLDPAPSRAEEGRTA